MVTLSLHRAPEVIGVEMSREFARFDVDDMDITLFRVGHCRLVVVTRVVLFERDPQVPVEPKSQSK